MDTLRLGSRTNAMKATHSPIPIAVIEQEDGCKSRNISLSDMCKDNHISFTTQKSQD